MIPSSTSLPTYLTFPSPQSSTLGVPCILWIKSLWTVQRRLCMGWKRWFFYKHGWIVYYIKNFCNRRFFVCLALFLSWFLSGSLHPNRSMVNTPHFQQRANTPLSTFVPGLFTPVGHSGVKQNSFFFSIALSMALFLFYMLVLLLTEAYECRWQANHDSFSSDPPSHFTILRRINFQLTCIGRFPRLNPGSIGWFAFFCGKSSVR